MPDIVTDPDAKGKMELKLYKFTEFYDKVEYAINRKGPNKIDGVNGKDIKIGYIDCSGWVATALNKTMEEINKSQGKKGEKDMFDVVDGANAAMILEKAKKAGSKVITGYDIADKLKEGMVIVENNPRESPKYDHIVMVVRDKSGKLYVSQSKAPEKDENG
ncbi:MAG TPA: hypothetical protein VEY92_10225, partial [Pseudoxanthomonas sp.]|nr:hypothetical protein [Pseudoxanthomonas sp.]